LIKPQKPRPSCGKLSAVANAGAAAVLPLSGPMGLLLTKSGQPHTSAPAPSCLVHQWLLCWERPRQRPQSHSASSFSGHGKHGSQSLQSLAARGPGAPQATSKCTAPPSSSASWHRLVRQRRRWWKCHRSPRLRLQTVLDVPPPPLPLLALPWIAIATFAESCGAFGHDE